MAFNNHMKDIEGMGKFWWITFHRYMGIAVHTFSELSIADKLINAPNEGLTAEDIAGEENWDAGLLYRLLRSCADAGLVQIVGVDNDHFCLTSTGKLLVHGDPSEAVHYVRCLQGPLFEKPATYLPDLIRQRTTFENIQTEITSGLNLYDWFGQTEQNDMLQAENGCNTAITSYIAAGLVENIDFSRFQSIVDCGGNQGVFLAYILKHYPTVKHGIVFDLDNTIKRATSKYFEMLHIAPSRFEFVAGSLFIPETIPVYGDAYILKNIIDAFDDEKVITVLAAIRQAVCNSKREKESECTVLIIGMHCLPAEDPSSKAMGWQAHALDIMESVLTGGKERTPKQFQRLITAAGLEYVNYYSTGQPESVIEAKIRIFQHRDEKIEQID